jgi:hypothetical protein
MWQGLGELAFFTKSDLVVAVPRKTVSIPRIFF